MKRISLTILFIIYMFNLFGQESKIEKEFAQIKSKIYPVIKVEISDNKEEADIKFTEDDGPIFKKIAGDLLCFYGIDRDTHFELIMQRHLPPNVGLDELDQYSHDNLLNFINDKIKIHGTEFGGFGFTCGGNHEAALLTLPEIWNIIIDRLGNSIVFAVPSKDLILFVSADKKSDIAGLQKMVKEIHQDGERLLSKKLYTYNNGIISVKE